MNQVFMGIITLLFSFTFLVTETFPLSGVVRESGTNTGISGVAVSLANANLSATTDAQGGFDIDVSSDIKWKQGRNSRLRFTLSGNTLVVSSQLSEALSQVELFTTDGRLLSSVKFLGTVGGKYIARLPEFLPGLTILRVTANGETVTQTIARLGDKLYSKNGSSDGETSTFTLAKQVAPAMVDTLIASKAGYTTAKLPIDSYNKDDIEITMEPITSECNIPDLPGKSGLQSIPKLPDPFTFKFADGGEVTTKAEWECRRQEIYAAAQEYIYGINEPAEVEASFSGGTLRVTARANNKEISFEVNISGGDPNNPKPILLQFGGFGGSLPGWPSGIVSASFPFTQIVADNQQPRGLFYDLYGTSHPGGELLGWAWGVGKFIDALEMTPEAGIDPTRVAVHGCSRYGKGALAVGALEHRVALTIPEEAGTCGGSAWRIIAAQKAAGYNIQDLRSGTTEMNWPHQDFLQFEGDEDLLPVDQHEVMGLVAPRGLLFLDGDAGNEWLGVTATYWTANATAEIFKALGAEEAFTYSQINSSHCQTPSGQSEYVSAYARYYLLGEGDPPEGGVHKTAARNFNHDDWIDWDTPTLQ